MDFFRPVDPNTPEARDAIVNLLGTTLAQLKEIDKNIVGSSKNISGIKTDLKSVFSNIPQANEPVPTPVPSHQPVVTTIQHQYAPSPAATVVNAGINVQQPLVTEDPNQLVFDFSKKITPDTINDKLDRLLDKLDLLTSKLDKLAIG